MRQVLVLSLSAMALAACSSSPLNRNAPDEFAILTKPPLTVPPGTSDEDMLPVLPLWIAMESLVSSAAIPQA